MTTPGSSRRPPAGTRGTVPAPLGGWRYQRHFLSSRSILETSSPTRGSSCSALGAAVIRHLLWPLLTSDDPSRRLSTPVAPWQTTRPPRVRRATFPLMPVGYTSWRSVQVLGFDEYGHLTPPCRLVSASCSSGQRFASGCLQILPRGRHPCRRLALPLAGRAGDFHPQVEAPPSGTAPSRRYAPCLAHPTASRVRRYRLIPLTEPYIRASYTAHVHSYLA